MENMDEISKHNERILDDVAFFLECEGLRVSERERQRGEDMLEGRISLDDVVTEILAKGRAYAEV